MTLLQSKVHRWVSEVGLEVREGQKQGEGGGQQGAVGGCDKDPTDVFF